MCIYLWMKGVVFKRVFVRVAVVSLACLLGPGHARPAPSAATVHVCLPACKRSGSEEIVFVNYVRTGLNHQIQLFRPPPPHTTCPHCAPQGVWLQNNIHPQRISRAILKGLFWLWGAGLRAKPNVQTHAFAA